jgi:cytoskeletal protein RodZ
MAILLPDRIDVTTFGEFLRDARERRGLTLQQIAHETRIPWRHLDALEHGNLDAVPTGVYRRAEIRAYADAVGLDRTLALTQFEHAIESSIEQPRAISEASEPDSRARTWWAAFGAIGVVAAATMFAVSLWKGERPVALAQEPPVIATPSAQAVAPPVTPGAVTPAPAGSAPAPAPVSAPVAVKPAVAAAPAAVASNAAPAPIATLTVTSDPSGARVMVDGIGRGSTPLTLDNLTAGSRRVRLIKDGFVSQERDVRLGTRPLTLDVRLDAVH